jgi:hypothetical protein
VVFAARRNVSKNILMHESIPFSSTCPKCRQDQLQCGYSRGILVRLLNTGREIEAYCETCDEFWAISAPERVRIANGLAG